MESKQYIDLFMLSLSYERVYKDLFHEIVREYIQQLDNSKLLNEFQNLEKTYNQIIEKISQYKLDYTSIETDKFKTTQEKEKTKELLFNNFYPDLLNNITNYLQNKKDFMSSNILSMAQSAIETLKSDKHFKGEVIDFYQRLKAWATMAGEPRKQAKNFIDNRLEIRYRYKSTPIQEQTESYYERIGLLHIYKQTVIDELNKLNLSSKSVLWWSELFQALHDNGTINGTDEKDLITYLANKTNEHIEKLEQEEIKTIQAFESLSAPKRGLLSKLLKNS